MRGGRKFDMGVEVIREVSRGYALIPVNALQTEFDYFEAPMSSDASWSRRVAIQRDLHASHPICRRANRVKLWGGSMTVWDTCCSGKSTVQGENKVSFWQSADRK